MLEYLNTKSFAIGQHTPDLSPVTEILLMILWNVGTSTVDRRCISSTIKAATNFFWVQSNELLLPGGECELKSIIYKVEQY